MMTEIFYGFCKIFLLLKTLFSTSICRFMVWFFDKLLIFRTAMHLKHPGNIIGRGRLCTFWYLQVWCHKGSKIFLLDEGHVGISSIWECFEKVQIEWSVLENVLTVARYLALNEIYLLFSKKCCFVL